MSFTINKLIKRYSRKKTNEHLKRFRNKPKEIYIYVKPGTYTQAITLKNSFELSGFSYE